MSVDHVQQQPPISPLSLTSTLPPLDNMEALHDELERLNKEIAQANEERAQAAEYGLVILEEKQSLQYQYEEMSGLYEGTKRELENSVNALKQVQGDYEKRLKDIETQREQLLNEMETRETTLLTKGSKMEEDIRQLERKLKQCSTEQEHLREHNNFLTSELDRHRRESEVLREEIKSFKREHTTKSRENEDLRKETEKLDKRVKKLAGFEEECDSLQETNRTLTEEVEGLRQHMESILIEKEDLEYQNQEAMEALNEERAAKSVLETKIQEESFRSPAHPSWEMEKENETPSVVDGSNHTNHITPEQQRTQNRSPSTPAHSNSGSNIRLHSTPYSPRRTPSLLSEIQSSLMASVDSSELETLRKRCKEAEDLITSLQREKLALEERVTSFSVEKTEASTRIEHVKEEYAKGIVEKDKTVEALKEDILVKEEMVGQLRNKLSTALAERASIEIEVDGIKDELQRVKQSTANEIDKVQRECIQEQTKCLELNGQVIVLEEQLELLTKTIEKFQKVVFNSNSELATMMVDLQKLHKMVVTLGPDASRNKLEMSSPIEMRSESAIEEEDESCYSLELTRYRTSIQIHGESNSLHAIVQLHEELKSVRTPLEQFTRTMLERSLANSAKNAPLSPTSPTSSVASSTKKNPDYEASVSKLKVKLAHKTEEVNNLRAIMKARATTADVAITSLRSKLEGQARAYQAEMTRLKHQIKTLKKERDEHLSLRTMYAKRCEDYVDEITKMRRELEKCKMDYDDVMLLLKKTIHRKLELSTELEEYRMEHERIQLIPKLLGSSRI